MEQVDQEHKKWVLSELERIEEDFQSMKIPTFPGKMQINNLVDSWKELRPKMTQRLKKLGILEEEATVRLALADEKMDYLLNCKMYETDAREQAEQILLRWVEEEEENEELE